MKSRILRTSIGSFIFLVLIIAAVAVVEPLYRYESARLREFEEKTLASIEEKFGLAVSYKSLSPSILSKANIKGISVKDAATNEELLEIKRSTVNYSIVSGIESIILDGVDITFDMEKNAAAVEKIKKFLDSRKEKQNPDSDAKAGRKSESEKPEKAAGAKKSKELEKTEKTLSQIIRNLSGIKMPFDVVVKNISISYSDKKREARLFIRKLDLDEDENNNYVFASMEGNFYYSAAKKKAWKKRESIGANYSISSSIFPEIDNSHIKIVLTSLSGVDYTFNDLELLASYTEPTVILQTTKSIHPFNLAFIADLEQSVVKAEMECENFKPFSMLKIRHKNRFGRFFTHLGLTISADAKLDFKDLKNPVLTYDVRSSAALPEQKGWPAFYGEVDCNGRNFDIDVTRSILNSTVFGAQFEGKVFLPHDFKMVFTKPSGVITIDHMNIKGRPPLSCEIYAETTDTGFMIFSPQIFLGDLSYTAFQVDFQMKPDSLDFKAEFDDYSHIDYNEPGHLSVDGSVLWGRKEYLQAYGKIDNFFMDSLSRFIGFWVPFKDVSKNFTDNAPRFEKIISSNEFFFSTDFKSVTYNMTYFLAANTEREGDIVMLECDGSNATVSVSNFTMLHAGQNLTGSATYDFGDLKKQLFTIDFNLNEIPYSVNGSFSQKTLTLSGDYNLNSTIHFDGITEGVISFDSLPFAAGKYMFTSTLDSTFMILDKNEFTASIMNFEIEEPSRHFAFAPEISFSASANQYGLIMDSLVYRDNSNVLNGSGNVTWQLFDGIFSSILVDLNIKSPISSQQLIVNCDLENKNRVTLGAKDWKDFINLKSKIEVKNFPLNIFISGQTIDNTISFNFEAGGTLAKPKIDGRLENISLQWWTIPFAAHADFHYAENDIKIENFDASWYTMKLENCFMNINARDYNATAGGKLGGSFWGTTLDAPFDFSMSNFGQKFMDAFSANLNFPAMSGSLLKKNIPLKISMLKNEGRMDFFTGDGNEITASIEKGGLINVSTSDDLPFNVKLEGIASGKFIDLNLSKFVVYLDRISQHIALPRIEFTSGVLSGWGNARGMPSDPELAGEFAFDELDLNWKEYLPKPLYAKKLVLTVKDDSIAVSPAILYTGKAKINFDAFCSMDRWRIDEAVMNVSTKNTVAPVNLTIPYIRYEGDAGVDAKLTYSAIDGIGFSGNLMVQNGDFYFIAKSLFGSGKKESDDDEDEVDVSANINIDTIVTFGNKLQFQVEPLMRGLVSPGNSLAVKYDRDSGDFNFKGLVELKGGDITWLNRNFYMKNGSVILNETQDKIDPVISLTAEVRERDEDGNQIKIKMDAKRQLLSQFKPILSSTPAKSEREIMEILGNVVTGDSKNASSFLLAGGDYIVQTMVMRKVENSLRKMLNFDIFSIRTMVLQNAVKQGINQAKLNNNISIGNFFDNSTVYIGKYIGNSLYLDALFNCTYDENKAKSNSSSGGLTFKPEIGIELSSPFVNIRYAIAPNIDALQNGMWKPASSITLSWKFNF